METLKINKTYDTYEELEQAERELSEKYMVLLINHMPQQLDKTIYGIESITHFGKRG